MTLQRFRLMPGMHTEICTAGSMCVRPMFVIILLFVVFMLTVYLS